jgi:hypothetical protein
MMMKETEVLLNAITLSTVCQYRGVFMETLNTTRKKSQAEKVAQA